MNINYGQMLMQLRRNPQIMGNQTVQSVFRFIDNKDHNGLVELYKNTCTTLGKEPNQMFLQQ